MYVRCVFEYLFSFCGNILRSGIAGLHGSLFTSASLKWPQSGLPLGTSVVGFPEAKLLIDGRCMPL